MRKILITIMLGASIFTLVSCGGKVVNEEDVKNKYPIDEYLEKGATLKHYYESGTAEMIDTKGQSFFAGENSTYKVVLSDEGEILPYIVIDDIAYYFDKEISKKEAPKELDKSGKISTFGGTLEGISDDSNATFTFIQSLIVYVDKEDNSVVYTQYADEKGYEVWKNYEAINK